MANIYVAATVYDIPNIDDIGGVAQVNLGLFLTWNDARLNFLNLVAKTDLNVLSNTEYASIWSPIVRFLNKAPNFKELEEVVSPTITIIANTSLLSPASEMYIANIFPGNNNTLYWSEQIR
jgi:hypothetical protein